MLVYLKKINIHTLRASYNQLGRNCIANDEPWQQTIMYKIPQWSLFYSFIYVFSDEK